jgi:hypothetical protein
VAILLKPCASRKYSIKIPENLCGYASSKPGETWIKSLRWLLGEMVGHKITVSRWIVLRLPEFQGTACASNRGHEVARSGETSH